MSEVRPVSPTEPIRVDTVSDEKGANFEQTGQYRVFGRTVRGGELVLLGFLRRTKSGRGWVAVTPHGMEVRPRPLRTKREALVALVQPHAPDPGPVRP